VSQVAPDDGLQQVMEGFELRLHEVEERVEQMALRIEQAIARLTVLAQGMTDNAKAAAEADAAEDEAQHAAPASNPFIVTPELARVIRLVQQGAGEEAQRELRRIPEEQLQEQPAVVALVAAALFVQRGDYATGLQALKRARTLTDDARLLRVMQLLEQQLAPA
jgi:hypothetical protein